MDRVFRKMRHIREKKHCECRLCGHQWDSRVENPKACPNCKRYDWDKPIIEESGELVLAEK